MENSVQPNSQIALTEKNCHRTYISQYLTEPMNAIVITIDKDGKTYSACVSERRLADAVLKMCEEANLFKDEHFHTPELASRQ